MKFFRLAETPLKGFNVVIPGISYKSVSQRCIDLLLTGNSVIHIGRLDSEFVVPSVSVDILETEELKDKGTNVVTSIEVYAIPSKKLIIVQQRMPALAFKAMKLTKEYIQFFKGQDVAGILTLGSLGPRSRVTREMIGGGLWLVDSNEGRKHFGFSEDIRDLITTMEEACPVEDKDVGVEEGREEGMYMNPLTSGYLYEVPMTVPEHTTGKHSPSPHDSKEEMPCENKYKTFHKNNRSLGNTLGFLELSSVPAAALVTTKTTTVVGGAKALAEAVASLFGLEVGKVPLGWELE